VDLGLQAQLHPAQFAVESPVSAIATPLVNQDVRRG
jgi:hypothetical protein